MAAAHSIALALRKAVIAGLIDHFADLPAFNGATSPEERVEVAYGFTFGSKAAEQVYLGRHQANTPPAGLRPGRNVRNEDGTFDINVHVRKPGANAEQAEARAFSIGSEIEDWVSLHKSGEGLGVTGLNWLVVESWAADYGGIDSGTGAVLTYTIRWNARLEGSP